MHSTLLEPVSSDCPARFLDCALRWSTACLCDVCCPDTATTSWLWSSSSFACSNSCYVGNTSISFLWSFLVPWPFLTFWKSFYCVLLMQARTSLSAFLNMFCEEPVKCVWCWSCQWWGERRCWCRAQQIKDLEPRRSLQTGKSHQLLPGHVVSQLPILQEQDLTGKCQQIQKQATRIFVCLGARPPALRLSVYWEVKLQGF